MKIAQRVEKWSKVELLMFPSLWSISTDPLTPICCILWRCTKGAMYAQKSNPFLCSKDWRRIGIWGIFVTLFKQTAPLSYFSSLYCLYIQVIFKMWFVCRALQSSIGHYTRHPQCVIWQQMHMDSFIFLFGQVKPVNLGMGKLLALGTYFCEVLRVVYLLREK